MRSAGDGAALPRVTPYRDYLAWLAAQDRAAAVAAWREALAGLEEPTRVGAAGSGTRAAVAPEQITLALSETLSAALTAQARRQGLTLNTVIQAAWAILLGRLTGRDDVVFGVTVAGRPPEIAGIETMVGLFINTLPLRVRLPPAKPLVELLQQVQDSQSRLMAHQHLGLAEIQSLAGLGELFDTLVVFENYPVDRSSLAARCSAACGLPTSAGDDATHYPLSLVASRASSCGCGSTIGPTCLIGRALRRWLGGWCGCWRLRLREPDAPIGRLEILAAAERARILRDWNATAQPVGAGDPAGAVCGAGGAHAGGDRGGVRGRSS